MKKTLLMPCLVAATLTGCALFNIGEDPNKAYYQAQEAFIAAVKTSMSAREAGMIEDDLWAEILVVMQRGNDILDRMDVARKAGDLDEMKLLVIGLTEVVAEMQQ